MSVLAAFIGLALTGAIAELPTVLHVTVLTIFAAGFGMTLYRVGAGLRPIRPSEIERRLEREAGLRHRPIAALYDLPVGTDGSPLASELWFEHVRRAIAAASRVRPAAPKPGLAALDRLGLRSLAAILLVIGIAVGADDPIGRMRAAMAPYGGGQALAGATLDLWITPPAYTGLAPLVFNGRSAAAVDPGQPALILPVGTQLLAQISGANSTPTLRIGRTERPFGQLGDAGSKSFKLEAEILGTDADAPDLVIGIGGNAFAAWPVKIATDAVPSVEFARAPSRKRGERLEIEYLAGDDYGIKIIELIVRRPGGERVPDGADEIRVELPLGGDRRRVEQRMTHDFSAHPWAGLPVRMSLKATDAAGQSARSGAIEVALPERIFNHPVARALADIRKRLNDPNAETITGAEAELDQLSQYPARFFDDTVTFLAIRVARGRLQHGSGEAEIASVQRLLWESALRIEDGEYALAEADLLRMQEQAMKALKDGATGKELAQVMRELQLAMDRFTQALMERRKELGLDNLPVMPDQQMGEVADLDQMMDRIKELAETGNRAAAERMLAEMQKMLEQLRDGLKMSRSNPQMAEAKKLMDRMRSLTEDQRKLLDRTFQENQRRAGAIRHPPGEPRREGQTFGQQPDLRRPGERPGPQQGPQQRGQQSQRQGQQPGNQPGGDKPGEGGGAPSAEEQDALRKRLGELMLQMDEMLGKIPENLGRAETEMDGAGRNLETGELKDAAGHQSKALDELRSATEQMATQMAQRFGAQMGISGSQQIPGGQIGSDPFGRLNSGNMGTSPEESDVEVPSEMETLKAREILDELRKRAGQRARPKIELDYIDRLLDSF